MLTICFFLSARYSQQNKDSQMHTDIPDNKIYDANLASTPPHYHKSSNIGQLTSQ